VEEVEHRCKELIDVFASKQEWEILFIEVRPDYCHLQISATPHLAPSDIVAKIKRITSQVLRQEFMHLNHLPSLWTRAFLVSTEPHISAEMITQFLQAQKTRG
jgi:putative transposase